MGKFQRVLKGIGLAMVFALAGQTHAWSADPGCEGIVRKVARLGGAVDVPAVEAIARARAEQLAPYTFGDSVRSQLHDHDAFGFVAIRDGRVAGYVTLHHEPGHFLKVKSIAVAAGMERRGVGRDLMEKVLELARDTPGVEDVRVIVRMADIGVQDFFESLGFEEVEILTKHFDNQMSGRVMKVAARGTKDPSEIPSLAIAPQPQVKRVAVATMVIPITRAELLKIDPTLANAN